MGARITSPPATAHPKVEALYSYWRSAVPSGRALPGRHHIDPVDIPRLLHNVWLLDAIGEPVRFRFRLIGEAIRRIGGIAKRGDFVDQFAPDDADPVRDLRFVVRRRQPVWFRGLAILPHAKPMAELERLFLPLAADGASVDMLLCLTVFYAADGREI